MRNKSWQRGSAGSVMSRRDQGESGYCLFRYLNPSAGPFLFRSLRTGRQGLDGPSLTNETTILKNSIRRSAQADIGPHNGGGENAIG